MTRSTTNGSAELTVAQEAGMGFVEGPPDRQVLRVADDVNLLLEACFSAAVDAAVLYGENLPAGFFDLSSGVAGAVLQKLRTYRIRLAVVCAPSAVKFSRPFNDMAAEERRGKYFGVFPSRQAAVDWLAGSERTREPI